MNKPSQAPDGSNEIPSKAALSCRYCKQEIEEGALKCQHCGEFQTRPRILLHFVVFIIVPIIAAVVAIYSASSSRSDRVDAEDALKEAERVKEEVNLQRTLVELWVETVLAVSGNRASEASRFLDKILKLDPDNRLSLELQLESLLIMADQEDPNDASRIDVLLKAESIVEKLEAVEQRRYAFDMACICALRRDEEGCKEWLLVAQRRKTLPAKQHQCLSYLRDYSASEWFKEIRWPEAKKLDGE